MKNTNRYEVSIIKNTRYFYIFALLALISPLVILFSPWSPEPLTVDKAFSRSGAVTVGFAIIAEFFVLEIFNTLKPAGGGFVGNDRGADLNKYRKYPAIMSKVVLILVVLGTLISSYGDLILKH